MAQTPEGAMLTKARRWGMSLDDLKARYASGQNRCTRCKTWKGSGAFGPDRSRPTGLSATCLDCRRAQRPRKTVGPSIPERRLKWAQGLAWCRACAAWLPITDVRQGLCRPHANADARHAYATNERRRLERRQHAHARSRAVAPIPADAQTALLERFDGLCAYCQKRPADTWDHIEPVVAGGQTLPWNVVPACSRCNSSKGRRDVVAWLEAKGHAFSDIILDTMVLEHVHLRD